MSALTALTAQNTLGVTAIHEVPPSFVTEQIDAVVSDIGVDALKTGMLASVPIIEAVAAAVKGHGIEKVVVDPVFVSKHRDQLLAGDAVGALKSELLPLATVITPNLHEASGLVGHEIATLADMREAAVAVHALGPRYVLIKGGHLEGESDAIDVLYNGHEHVEFRGPRFDTKDTHGTGCALSAAITAHLAHGASVAEAVGRAKEFISGAIDHSLRLGRGYGPVNPGWALGSQRDE